MSAALLAAGARVFFQAGCAPLYYRNNVAVDATEVRVAGMADVPGCPVSFVLRQSRTREASVSLPQIDETDVPLTCSDSGSASLTCLVISGTIDAPGWLLSHVPEAPQVSASLVPHL